MLRLVGAIIAAWAVLVAVLFALYHGGAPVPANAVVVLEGSNTRLPVGLRLVHEGYAPLLVVSRGDNAKVEQPLCAGKLGVRVRCFVASPPSTRGEAEYVGLLARSLHLKRLDVVTSQFHVLRAEMLVRRCYHGDLQMVGAPQPWWKLPWYAVTESVKFAYQLVFQRSC